MEDVVVPLKSTLRVSAKTTRELRNWQVIWCFLVGDSSRLWKMDRWDQIRPLNEIISKDK